MGLSKCTIIIYQYFLVYFIIMTKSPKESERVSCDKCGTPMNQEPCEGTFGINGTNLKMIDLFIK